MSPCAEAAAQAAAAAKHAVCAMAKAQQKAKAKIRALYFSDLLTRRAAQRNTLVR